jgi:hypothetical protein
MHDQLGFDMAQSGAMVALPNIISFASLWLAAQTADRLIQQGTPVATVRWWMTVISGIVPAACVVGLIYAKEATTILVLFNVALFFQGFYCAGGALTLLDLFPDHAGAIMGVDNAINNVPGFLAPMVAGMLLDQGGCPTDSPTSHWKPSTPQCDAAWAKLWWLSAGLYALGTVVYCCTLVGHSYVAHSDSGDSANGGWRNRRRAPVGALLCDRLLFGAAFDTTSTQGKGSAYH